MVDWPVLSDGWQLIVGRDRKSLVSNAPWLSPYLSVHLHLTKGKPPDFSAIKTA